MTTPTPPVTVPMPSNVQHGVVKGVFMTPWLDPDAPDSAPRLYPMTGTVKFTPKFTSAKNVTSNPPMTVMPAEATAKLIGGTFRIKLMSNLDPDLNPSGWTWWVTFDLHGVDNVLVPYEAFGIDVPVDPTDEQDLTLVAKLGEAEGIQIIRGPAGDSVYKTWTEIPGNEGKTEQEFIDAISGGASGDYAPLVHTHVMADITDLEVNAVVSQGPVVLFDGDSTMAGNNGGVLDQRGNSVPLWAMIYSEGRYVYGRSIAVPGQTIQDALERFDIFVTPNSPDIVHLLIGANNVKAGSSAAVYLLRLGDYLAKCRDIGAQLVLGIITPRWGGSSTEPERVLTQRYARVARKFCADNGVPMVDYYSELVDPATGGFKAGLGSVVDGTHPTSLGNQVMAEALSDVLKQIIPPWQAYMPTEANDTNNLVSNPLFDGNLQASGAPASWAFAPTTIRTGVTASLVTDPAIYGRWYRLSWDATFVSTQYLMTTMPPFRLIPGHRYQLVCRMQAEGLRNADTGQGVSLNFVAVQNGSDTTEFRARALSGTCYDFTDGYVGIEFTAHADVTSMNVQLQVAANGAAVTPGYVQIAQVGLIDLTNDTEEPQ